ncbi:alpha-galactosidase [Cryobacterium melibiosiphilum]|uniref:Alpha-galactosidase n=1 Tax=Cryobacterium melibiosiphilum TaxID=995039 RepID=A0A3A5MB89_9MICO|nr:alpha-galactosidase [Cryobacterium melibiosiphilum]RJT87387.1 alpha-galactosidase [Cryobacterium melibiosiphilum]
MPLNTEPAPTGTTAPATGVVHLRRGGVSVVLDLTAGRLPVVAYWGGDLGHLGIDSLAALVRAGIPAVVPNDLDVPELVEVLPGASGGWRGQPGIEGHTEGADWTLRFTAESATVDSIDDTAVALTATAIDPAAGIRTVLRLELLPSGLFRHRATVTRVAGAEYVLDSLQLALPVPRRASELLDLAGRWGHERTPQRLPFAVGTHLRDSRRGRTGTDAALILAAGTPGFGFNAGEVWALHVGWSGNHREYAERLSNGTQVLGGGELLLPGEVRLAAGDSYDSPWVYASWGRGLDQVAERFHDYLRSRPGHPSSPRPVVLNTWEAVYFDHDLGRLTELAEAAAEVGAERFVLDDGWFRHRRDDSAGLGDWYVDETVWPDGLDPLIDRVTGLGLQFGLWVEPEMINPDSDLARAHPEWMLAPAGRLPVASRQQQVLDLGHPEAFAHILQRLDEILTRNRIGYLKWDHNRDLVEAGHSPTGAAGVHEQTLAVYRLLDELRERHPGVEIESCSSGGGRADLGILERTDRIWASDVIDPLERQQIQRWTGQLVPPELVGSHVGSPTAHTTGRSHALSFRAGTALFGHFGIEWDISRATQAERAELADWVSLYKELRGLLHTGRVVRADHADASALLHGVVGETDALFAFVQLTTPLTAISGPVVLPGLEPAGTYRVAAQYPGDRPNCRSTTTLPWLGDGGVTLPGSVLAESGLQMPALHPEQLLLLRVTRVG